MLLCLEISRNSMELHAKGLQWCHIVCPKLKVKELNPYVVPLCYIHISLMTNKNLLLLRNSL